MESKENSARKKKIVSFLREWGLIFAIVIITLVAHELLAGIPQWKICSIF